MASEDKNSPGSVDLAKINRTEKGASKEIFLDVFSRGIESEPFSWERISHECTNSAEAYKMRCQLVVENCNTGDLKNKNIERLLVLLNCFDLQKSIDGIQNITKLKISVLTGDYKILSDLIEFKLNGIDTDNEKSLLNILDIKQILTLIVEVFFVCAMDPLKKDDIKKELLNIERLCGFKLLSLENNIDNILGIKSEDFELFKKFIHNTILYCETILFFGFSTDPNQPKSEMENIYKNEKKKLEDLKIFFEKDVSFSFDKNLTDLSKDRFQRNYDFLNTCLDLLYLKFKERTLFNVDCYNDSEQYNIEDIYNNQQSAIKFLFQSYSKVAGYKNDSKKKQKIEEMINLSYVVSSNSNNKSLNEESDSKSISLIASIIFDDFIENLQNDYIYIGELFLVVSSIVHFVNFYDEKLVKTFQNNINIVLQKKQILGGGFEYPYRSFEFTDTMVDISIDSKNMLELLKKITVTDPLTGLYNVTMFRRDFNKYSSYTLRHSKQEDFVPNKWIFALDIDNFKIINDTYGHGVGDSVLKEFSNIVNDLIRLEDNLYRVGGEEFIILCECGNKQKAQKFANKILVGVENQLAEKMRKLGKFPKDGKDSITLSIGGHNLVNSISGDVTCVQGLGEFKNLVSTAADNVLYYSKNTGRNKVTFSDDPEYLSLGKNKNSNKFFIDK